MPIKIITADERMSRPAKVNIALFGAHGLGKTYQARFLNPETTLFIDMEAGDLAVGDWRGEMLEVRAQAYALSVHPWVLCRALACVMCGPDPAEPSDGPYSQASYDSYVAGLGAEFVSGLAKYNTVFWDSITVASRHCFAWSKMQPEAFSEKNGKPDTRGAYGKLGQEMVRWLTTIQHISGKNTIVVGILNEETDELRKTTYSPQIEGGKTGRELPGIFDEVLTLVKFQTDDGQEYRAFVTHQMNPWGYPAKDRSGCLDMIEPPNLGALIAKIQKGVRNDGVPVTGIPVSQTQTTII